MGKLTYGMITSLDGYVADQVGAFDWAQPDEELHTFINARTAPVGTYLYGRRMHETMSFWQTAHLIPDPPEFFREWTRLWQAADKVVYSRTLDHVSGERTRLEREFDPDAVRALKASSDRELTVGGPGLGAAALRAGLVDEIEQYVCPVIVGGGTALLPPGIKLELELEDELRFGNGVVCLRYAVGQDRGAGQRP
jgi:dihydrofolate reductase